MKQKIKSFVVHKSPDIDCLTALWLMYRFGYLKFEGTQTASTDFQSIDKIDGKTMEKEGIIALDCGKWRFDHHDLDPEQENLCATVLVAKYLGIDKINALDKILKFVQRKDVDGKGVISKDGLDQAFHFSTFVDDLNSLYPENPDKIQEIVFALLDAHYLSEKIWFDLLDQIKKADNIQTHNGKIVYLVSDSHKAARASRYRGFDVCIIQNTQTNNIAIQWNSTKFQEKDHKNMVKRATIYLRFLEALYRGEKINIKELLSSETYLGWFLHSSCKFVLYGSSKISITQNSQIPKEFILELVAYAIDNTRGLPVIVSHNQIFKELIKIA
ncbi:MAG: hypothetical protein WCG25_09265 [bacterium]